MYNCLFCGKECIETKQKSNVYCSLKCQGKNTRKSLLENWTSGQFSGSIKGGKLSYAIKRALKEKFHWKCSLCGWGEINPFTKKVPIEIDHIDGNWNNNRPENLRVLCPNCHALQSTHKGANRGKGRPYTIKYT